MDNEGMSTSEEAIATNIAGVQGRTVQDLQEKALNCRSILKELQQAEEQMAAEGKH